MSDELAAVAEPAEIEAPETTEEAAEPVEGETREGSEQEPREEIAKDGRVVPQAYRELFKAQPELKDMFFQLRTFKETFPGGVQEAKQMLDYISEKGGKDAIESIAQQLEETKQVDQMLAAGDAKIFDHVEKIAPGAVAKLAPEVLSRWSQTDPDGCNAMLCGVVANSLNGSEIPQQLFAANMALKFAARDPAIASNPAFSDLTESLKAIGDSITAFSSRSQAASAQSRQAPAQDGQQKWEQEKAEFQSQQFNGSLDTKVENEIAPRMFKEAADLGYKDLSDRQKGLLYQESINELNKVLGKDFQEKFGQAKQKRDLDAAMRLVTSRAPASLPDIVKRVSRELFGSPVGRSTPAPKPAVVQNKPATPRANERPTDPFKGKLADIFAR